MKSKFFHRFDDIGKYDKDVEDLLRGLDNMKVPQLLAVIPNELDDKMAAVISDLKFKVIMQHGYTHVNYKASGWCDEFPSERSSEDIESSLIKGKAILENIFECEIKGYVPPWNNTSSKTLDVLKNKGYRVYSSQVNNSPDMALVKLDVTLDVNDCYEPTPILKGLDVIKRECLELSERGGMHGIMYHPNDYSKDEVTQLLEFIKELAKSNLSYEDLTDLTEGTL